MKNILSFLIFIMAICLSRAQTTQIPQTAFSHAAGFISLLQDDSAVSLQNPALVRSGILFSYMDAYGFYDSPDIISAIGFTQPHFSGSAGNQYFGDSYYKENCSWLSLSSQYKQIIIGGNIRYLLQEVKNYDRIYYSYADLGIALSTDVYSTTLYTKNLINLHKGELGLAKNLNMEGALKLYKRVKMGIGVSKEKGFPIGFQYSASAKLYQNLSLTGGYQTENQETSYGIQFEHPIARIGYCAVFHPYLQPSHLISVQYSWN